MIIDDNSKKEILQKVLKFKIKLQSLEKMNINVRAWK